MRVIEPLIPVLADQQTDRVLPAAGPAGEAGEGPEEAGPEETVHASGLLGRDTRPQALGPSVTEAYDLVIRSHLHCENCTALSFLNGWSCLASYEVIRIVLPTNFCCVIN